MNRMTLIKAAVYSLLLTGLSASLGHASLVEVGISSAPSVARRTSGGFGSAIYDASVGYAFFGSSSTNFIPNPFHYSFISEINISTFQYVNANLDTSAVATSTNVANLTAAVYDPTTGFGYFTSSGSPAIIVGASLITPGVGVNPSTVYSSMTLASGEDTVGGAVIDPANGFAYFGTNSAKVAKVRLSDFTEVDNLSMPAGFGAISAAVIDTQNGFAFFASTSSPGAVAKINLSNFTITATLKFNTREDGVGSAVIDVANQYAYFGTTDSPGVVVRVGLPSLDRISSLTLQAGQNDLTSAVIDAANNLAYFGTNTSTGIVVPVYLSSMRESTTPGPLTLPAGQNFLRSAFIDTVNSYAYFGTYTTPGIVAKIDLMAGPPIILFQPSNTNAHAGDVVAFHVSAYGRGLSYQWNINGVPIPGAASTSYSRTVVITDDASDFTCTITGTNGVVVTNGSVLTVLPVIQAYPNPWRVDKDQAYPITFSGMAPNSTVKIFNLAAHWVKSLPPGQTTWDLTNDRGERVASGYYFYVVTTSDANQTQTGKIAIIH